MLSGLVENDSSTSGAFRSAARPEVGKATLIACKLMKKPDESA